jgi:site-specific DNA-methyltransferase (adenine-specific)
LVLLQQGGNKMIIESLRALAVPIDTLKGLPNNPRLGDVETVAASLTRFGQRKPIVVRKDDGTIIAGNHTWQAAKKLGWTEIAVAYVGDDDVTAKAFALADNRTAELGSYDEQALLNLIEEVHAVVPEFVRDAGWSDDAVAELVAKIESEQIPQEVDEDEIPEPPVEPVTKLGDIWQLGRHRLMCGDSTDEIQVTKLMNGQIANMIFTDPPYGVDYKGINNDSRDGLENLLRKSFEVVVKKSEKGCSVYIFHSDKNADIFHKVFREFFHFSSMIIWVKNSLTLSQTDYQSQHEPCLYGWEKNGTHKWFSDRKQTSIWQGTKERVQGHTTPKPIEIVSTAIKNSSKIKDKIVDIFGGSGSTLIACEQLNRDCYMMELDPKYCDVIIERWETLTGEKAVLVQNAESAKA